MFKIEEDLKPDYIAVAFDLKAPTARHKMYEGYKATRHGMPNELAEQMPIIKEILKDMNITIIEKEGYEADDILGTLSKRGEKEGTDVTILTGDRDAFQLTSDHITVRIPRTKAGKTEVEDFDRSKVLEVYGLEPEKLIEVKGLQGDTSDNIPGVPGVGEKTALNIVKEYGSIENLYKEIEEERATSIKGKTREKIIENKELAFLSKELGTINTNVPIEENLESLKKKEWNKEAVLQKFKELKFNRYIERFNLNDNATASNTTNKEAKELFEIVQLDILSKETEELINKIKENKEIIYYLDKVSTINSSNIIKKEIKSISIIIENKVYYINNVMQMLEKLKEIFESTGIKKVSYKIKEDYVILKEHEITMQNLNFDVEIASYLLNPTASKYMLESLSIDYLELDVNEYMSNKEVGKKEDKQINLFDSNTEEKENSKKYEVAFITYVIKELKEILTKKLEEQNSLKLFNEIEMPLAEVLAKIQYEGMYIDKEELISFGEELKKGIEELTKEIYSLAGEEFNINSTQQLGNILFEKLNLTT